MEIALVSRDTRKAVPKCLVSYVVETFEIQHTRMVQHVVKVQPITSSVIMIMRNKLFARFILLSLSQLVDVS